MRPHERFVVINKHRQDKHDCHCLCAMPCTSGAGHCGALWWDVDDVTACAVAACMHLVEAGQRDGGGTVCQEDGPVLKAASIACKADTTAARSDVMTVHIHSHGATGAVACGCWTCGRGSPRRGTPLSGTVQRHWTWPRHSSPQHWRWWSPV